MRSALLPTTTPPSALRFLSNPIHNWPVNTATTSITELAKTRIRLFALLNEWNLTIMRSFFPFVPLTLAPPDSRPGTSPDGQSALQREMERYMRRISEAEDTAIRNRAATARKVSLR